MSEFSPLMTLHEAQEKLRDLVNDGCECPCCTQFAKVYRRKVNSSMARDLISMWRFGKDAWMYLPDVRRQARSRGNREESKLRYWGLVEEEPDRRPDGGRAGWWRITPAGVSFVLGTRAIPKYALVYDGRCLGFRGDIVTIIDALGDRFDYRELMDS